MCYRFWFSLVACRYHERSSYYFTTFHSVQNKISPYGHFYQVSTRSLYPCLCCSRLDLGLGQYPTLAPALTSPGPFLDLCLHSSPDQDPAPGLSSRTDPAHTEFCPCLESISGPDWSVPLCLCQSSTPGPGVGLCLEPRRQVLAPCWSSSSDHEAGTAPR